MTDDPLSDPFLSSDKVAEMFDVTGYTARLWLRDGLIRGIKVNGRWKARRSEVMKFANEKYGDSK